jgi:hypothetical protein
MVVVLPNGPEMAVVILATPASQYASRQTRPIRPKNWIDILLICDLVR